MKGIPDMRARIYQLLMPLSGALFLAIGLIPGSAQDSAIRMGGEIPPEVDEIYDRGLSWLASKQGEDGAWQDGQSGAGVNGICVMAFLASGEDPNFGRWAPNVRRGLQHMILSQDEKTGYLPDSMYNHGFALLALAEAVGAIDEQLLWQGSEKKGRTINRGH